MERAELARRLGAAGVAVAPRDVRVAARDPGLFMVAFADAVAAGGTVWVADPSWSEAERTQFAGRQPSAAMGSSSPAGWLCLPTGGSGGVVRSARHDEGTIAAAVEGCRGHFQVDRINAVGVLPLHHVSGLMAWMRCALTGGRYQSWAWGELEAGRWPEMGGDGWFLSLVPTQLQRLLETPRSVEPLRRFRAVLLGGGPAWPDLLERARAARVPLAPSYGMTETAAMVTALRPEEFLAGRTGCGAALPHARVTVDTDGVIRTAGGSLFRGYYPGWREAGDWRTEDFGRIDEHGGLHVVGRRDAIIITGGEKVDPDAVEAALRATGQFADVAVVGVPDARWGQAVVACFPGAGREPDLEAVGRELAASLAPHKRPKRYLRVDHWPRTESGKLNRPALIALAAAGIGAKLDRTAAG
jgi:O-succinylbenzoic acid--CoA ligase